MRYAASVLILFTAVTAGAGIVKRGAAISPDAKVVPFADVLEKPSDFEKTPVVVEGVVAKNCTNKGCWIELVPEVGKPGVRVTFKDYAFFVPLDSKGMKVRAVGVTTVKVLTKKDADHLEGEGAKLNRNEDGTAREVSFVASGIELKRR